VNSSLSLHGFSELVRGPNASLLMIDVQTVGDTPQRVAFWQTFSTVDGKSVSHLLSSYDLDRCVATP
jgi:hypothetical protein